MNISVVSKHASVSSSFAKAKTSGFFSILIGSAFIFLIGFAHIEAVHNAAHDTRHANGFPCH